MSRLKAGTVARLKVALGLLIAVSLGSLFGTSASVQVTKAAQDVVATGVVHGIVLDARTHVPLRSATVQLSSVGDAFERVTVSQEDGRFEIKGLPNRRFRVSATKAGYLRAHVGQTHYSDPDGTVVPMEDHARDGIVLRMWPSATIEGIVRDRFGEPMGNVQVQLLRTVYDAGERLVGPGEAPVMTDSRGAFRVGGLMPGQFYVAARIRHASAKMLAYAPTYYPQSMTLVDARPVTVHSGESVTLELWMSPTQVPSRLSGVVLDPNGQPVGGRIVTLGEVVGTSVTTVTRTYTDARGAFTFEGLWPGTFVARTSVIGLGGVEEAAALRVSVDGDVSGVSLVSRPPRNVSGRIVATQIPPHSLIPAALRIGVTPLLGGAEVSAQVREDLSFVLQVPPGLSRIRVDNLPQGFVVGSVDVDGTKARGGRAELAGGERLGISIVSARAEIAGIVTGTRTDAFGHGAVVAFPVDRAARQAPYLRAVPLGASGIFAIGSLPAGDYYVVAMGGIDTRMVTNPDLLEQVESRSTTLRLASDERRSLELVAVFP